MGYEAKVFIFSLRIVCSVALETQQLLLLNLNRDMKICLDFSTKGTNMRKQKAQNDYLLDKAK